MAEKTSIAWCHATFNPWWGCVEVSTECDRCYARELSQRLGRARWGKDAPRFFFGDKHWAGPGAWNRKAAAAGERRRVFCASMADVCEERDDLEPHRQRLWTLIRETPALDWLLLTKRAGAMGRLIPADILALPYVWPGVTCGHPDSQWRVEKLVELECAGPRWVSAEPLLDALRLEPWLGRIGWVITGGESGSGYRVMDLAWLRALVDQCRDARSAIFVKQDSGPRSGQQGRIPDELWVQEWPR
jgi:protein gp37